MDRRSALALHVLAFAALAGLATPALAQEEEEPSSRFSGAFQLDITNVYFFRGLLQERDGLIAQPWAELYFDAYSSETGFIRNVTLGAGVWNSMHSRETLASDEPGWIYETDWYPLISIGLPQGFTLSTYYYWYTSPNDAFRTAQELNFKLEWDDSEALGRFALAPWANLAIETNRTAFGPDEGVGLQLGVEPTLYTFEHERYPVSFTVPVEVGLAIDDYYEEEDGREDTFGYVSFGLSMSVPLPFVPESLGAWSFGVTAKGYYFNDTLEELNEGDELYPMVMGSLGVEF